MYFSMGVVKYFFVFKESSLQAQFHIKELWNNYPVIHLWVLQELLKLLGIPVLKAREEAEALCAQLNREGHVDACITADSDAFLFGAKCVIKCIRPNCKVSFSIFILEFSVIFHLIKAKKILPGPEYVFV